MLRASYTRASLRTLRVSCYHSKVTAYPFTISPTEALESFASVPLTPYILNSFDPMKLSEYFFKYNLNIPKATEEVALKPEKFSAVYYPAWFLYAALHSSKNDFGILINQAYVRYICTSDIPASQY